MHNATVRWFVAAFASFILVGIGWHCKGTDVPLANIAPITRLSNVPPTDTFIVTKNPRLTLNWVGDDPDGFVVAFQYRWNFRLNSGSPFEYKPYSTVLNIIVSNFALMTDAGPGTVANVYHYFATLPPEGLNADSANGLDSGRVLTIAGSRVWASNPKVIRFPVHTNPNSGTFIFDSQDSLNPHTFEVSAIDNQGLVGTAATVTFGTPRVPPPQTQITASPGDTVLVLDQLTDTFTGVTFQFQGFDPNSRTIDYSWVIDKDQWPQNAIPWSPFSQSTTAFVTAANFPDPYQTHHRFYVRGRNEFGSIDTLGYYVHTTFDANNNPTGFDTIYANVAFNTLYPNFRRPGYQQRILLLNDCYQWTPPGTVARPTQAQVDAFYTSILDAVGKAGKYDVFDVFDDSRAGVHIFPGRGVLGQYSSVIFVQDVLDDLHTAGNTHGIGGSRERILGDYLNVGGKMILSAWALPFALNGSAEFVRLRGHMQDARADLNRANFIGARGDKGYPDILVDISRIDTATLGPGLTFIWPGRPYGFGEIIYRYNAADDNSTFPFTFPPQLIENTPIGVRYIGVTYSVVYLGFPLYYMEPAVATEVIRKSMDDIKELNP
jgi:hypothetical protein